MSSFDSEKLLKSLSEVEAYISAARSQIETGHSVEHVSADVVHKINEIGVQLYAIQRRLQRDPGYFSSPQAVGATEVMVAASAMLKSANLEVFELGMWQTWSGT